MWFRLKYTFILAVIVAVAIPMFAIPFYLSRPPHIASTDDQGVYANAENYLQYIINEYPFWNQTNGIDHFFVTCHDTGARLSERVPPNNSITVLCSANGSGCDSIYKFHHITLPQIRLPFVSPVGGNDRHHRTTIAFWACRKSVCAGDNLTEQEKFKMSRYCICDGSSHLTRICITDSIHYGCVPVILYDSYELPFNKMLDWTKFSVIINEDNAHRVERHIGFEIQ